MQVPTTPQGSSWDSNIYVLATTRIFVLMGTAYLVRSLYNLVWGSRPASIVAAVVNGLGLEEINLDTLPTVPGSAGNDPDLEANLTVALQLPRRSYDPQDHVQRSQASPRARGQRVGTSESSIATNAIPEQDVGVRHGATHVEEDNELAVGHDG